MRPGLSCEYLPEKSTPGRQVSMSLNLRACIVNRMKRSLSDNSSNFEQKLAELQNQMDLNTRQHEAESRRLAVSVCGL